MSHSRVRSAAKILFALLLGLSSAAAFASTPCTETLTAEKSFERLQKIALESLLFVQPNQAQALVDELGRIGRWGISRNLLPNGLGLSLSSEASFFIGGRDDFKIAIIPHACGKVNIVVLNAPGLEIGVGAGASVSGNISMNFNVSDEGRMDGYTFAAGAAVTALTGVGAFGFFSVYPSDAALAAQLAATNLTHDEVSEVALLQKLYSPKRSFGIGAGWGAGFGGKFIALVGRNTELKRMTVDEDQVVPTIKNLMREKLNSASAATDSVNPDMTFAPGD